MSTTVAETSMVIIAEDTRLPSQYEGAIQKGGQLSVVLKTPDVYKAIKKLKDLKVDFLLIDLKQVDEEKIGFLIKLKISQPESKILVITEEYSLHEWLQFLKAGVRGILEPDFSGKDLSAVIQVVNQGGIYIEPSRLVQFLEQAANKIKHAEEKAGDLLTDREIQVLKILAEGYTVKRAAELLDLSPKTVDTHKANLMRKINIHHRADLIKYALRKKIISLQDD